MTIISKKHSLLVVAAAVSVLLVVPGCSLFDKSNNTSSARSAAVDSLADQNAVNDNSPAIVTMSGKPLITQDRLEREKQNLIDTQPQLKQMIAMMPAGALDKQLLMMILNQEIIGQYIKDKGIDQTPAYKMELSQALKSIPPALNAKYFMENILPLITDSELKAFYDANKDLMPELVVSRGGVNAQGVSFETEQEAQAFLDKMNTMSGDIQKTADDMNVELQDFKQVNNQSINVGAQLREKIIGIATFPAVKMFNADNAFWVVKVISKEPVKYREFESLKNDLRQYLGQKELGQKKAEEEIARLRKDYDIVVDDSFFGGAQDNDQSFLDEMPMDEDMNIDQEESQPEAHNQPRTQMRTATAA